jgi:hypothetical protein
VIADALTIERHAPVSPRHCAACLTHYRLESVEIMRGAEMRNRSFGRYEHANAIRQYADDLEGFARHGGNVTDLVWDSGVFDRHGPPDACETPYLVEESPRLQTCATCPAPVHYVPGARPGYGSVMLRRNGRYVCKACFDAGGAR